MVSPKPSAGSYNRAALRVPQQLAPDDVEVKIFELERIPQDQETPIEFNDVTLGFVHLPSVRLGL